MYEWTWDKIFEHYQKNVQIGEDNRPSMVKSARAMLEILTQVQVFTEKHVSLSPYLSHSGLCITNKDNDNTVLVYFDPETQKYQTSHYQETENLISKITYLTNDEIVPFIKLHLKIS